MWHLRWEWVADFFHLFPESTLPVLFKRNMITLINGKYDIKWSLRHRKLVRTNATEHCQSYHQTSIQKTVKDGRKMHTRFQEIVVISHNMVICEVWHYEKNIWLLVAFGVVAEWSKVLTAIPWLLMVWSTLALGTYQLRFVSWVFNVIFSFIHFILLYTLGGLRAFRKPLPYNMYLFNLRIVNHILIKVFF